MAYLFCTSSLSFSRCTLIISSWCLTMILMSRSRKLYNSSSCYLTILLSDLSEPTALISFAFVFLSSAFFNLNLCSSCFQSLIYFSYSDRALSRFASSCCRSVTCCFNCLIILFSYCFGLIGGFSSMCTRLSLAWERFVISLAAKKLLTWMLCGTSNSELF